MQGISDKPTNKTEACTSCAAVGAPDPHHFGTIIGWDLQAMAVSEHGTEASKMHTHMYSINPQSLEP
jgi:hypothetical protein